MVAYDMRNGNAWYLDSWNKRLTNVQRAKRVLLKMRQTLGRRDGEARVVQDTPSQCNGRGPGVDCGVFVCSWLLRYCLGEENGFFRVWQRDMNEFRMHLAISVMENVLVL